MTAPEGNVEAEPVLEDPAEMSEDAIVAEDMAEFPDLNLAESLQRVPGVAISRSNGEGNQITVRGLSGLYTRVRINGMEARSSVLRSMGILANYTYVDSEANYDFLGNSVTERLIGLSNGQYNATLYYDDSMLDARVSLAYRSDFLDVGPNSTGNLWEYVEGSTRIDASSGYNVTENLKVSLEALNLTNAPFARKIDLDAERRFLYNKAGRTFILGARISY